MSDAIDRQAAIEAVEQIRYRIWEVDIPSPTVPEYIEHHEQMQELLARCDSLRRQIEDLPSVQPDVPDINVGDIIYRQAAIEAVETKIKKWNAVDGEGYHVGLGLRYTDVIDTLTGLPSVQPDNDMIHLQKEQAYLQGWEEGREALRKEMWEDGRDRLD